jgi:hypothetical protein
MNVFKRFRTRKSRIRRTQIPGALLPGLPYHSDPVAHLKRDGDRLFVAFNLMTTAVIVMHESGREHRVGLPSGTWVEISDFWPSEADSAALGRVVRKTVEGISPEALDRRAYPE